MDGWLGSKCDLKRTCKEYEGYGEGVKILSNAVDKAVPAYCKGDGERINDILNYIEMKFLSQNISCMDAFKIRLDQAPILVLLGQVNRFQIQNSQSRNLS